jgi:hypothetical protein
MVILTRHGPEAGHLPIEPLQNLETRPGLLGKEPAAFIGKVFKNCTGFVRYSRPASSKNISTL